MNKITEIVIANPIDTNNKPFCEVWRGDTKRTYPIDINKYFAIRGLGFTHFVSGDQYAGDSGNAWHFYGR